MGKEAPRKKISPRKLYLRWLNRRKTKSCIKEKECYPVETYSSIEEAKTVYHAELKRLEDIEEERRNNWYDDFEYEYYSRFF